MEIIKLIQGDSNWHKHRLFHDNASESAAMLGLDKHIKRDELIRLYATGDEQEFSDYVKERIFKPGHKMEDSARKIIAEEIGEDLYPVTGVDGRLSASFDGLTILEDQCFEHKQWNEELAAFVAQGIVPDTHMPQIQQQLMISKAEKNIFVVSDGSIEKREMMDVLPDPAWFERIKVGWIQFHKDVDNYKPVEIVVEVVGKPVSELPVINYDINGTSITSNANLFGESVSALVEMSRSCKYETDQDFGDAKTRIKAFKDGEKKARFVADMIIVEIGDINTVRALLLECADMMRTQRLHDEKQVDAKSKQIRNDTLIEYKSLFQSHWHDLNMQVGSHMPQINPNFALAMKGKRTVAGLNSACNDLLASSKIEANVIAKRIKANLDVMNDIAGDYGFLFNDIQQIIIKDREDLINLAKQRIAEHKEAEEKRLKRERIRKEDEAKMNKQEYADVAAKEDKEAHVKLNLPVWYTCDECGNSVNDGDVCPCQKLAVGSSASRNYRNKQSRSASTNRVETSFDIWWRNDGSRIIPSAHEDHSEHVARVARIAWNESKY